ncbi:MAG: proline--tRNA ligase [Alphaproteobacteria bacterium]|jgi:prolyl-tRNA synthetase|nr:proline--tRNA ligase [Alphaproteobacteria bacterium]MDP7222741.1 proline--tRNA ligase [Alphaproteobacteria bacterium]
MNKPNAQQQQKKKVRTAITPTRDEDFPIWYQNVIKAADMAENSPVRGSMVIKPYGFALWENVQRALDDMIKDADVQNAYFPLLIPLEFISREAEHVEGFAKECAVVTHHRLEQNADGKLVPAEGAKLEDPYVIRPTSETIIGDSMSKWINSYRDLPLKLNQWCNVMRWEMRTRLFLRTAEFLWQEGHNAFGSAEEAHEDAMKMLGIYERLYREYLAMPGIAGEKTADERFPGANNTYTYESMMQDGKALQACTSHDLGQNFAKSSDIQFQNQNGEMQYAYTTSWGLSTRSIGGLIMTHADDDGMVMPPKVAPYHAVILPIIRDDATKGKILEACEKLKEQMRSIGLRVQIDASDRRTPDKMWDSIKKGVPLRIEIGAREVDDGTLTHVRRDLGRESKTTCATAEFMGNVQAILDDIQAQLYSKAEAFQDNRINAVSSIEQVGEFYKEGGVGFVSLDSAHLGSEALDKIMKKYSLTPRCLPFEDEGKTVIIAKSY